MNKTEMVKSYLEQMLDSGREYKVFVDQELREWADENGVGYAEPTGKVSVELVFSPQAD